MARDNWVTLDSRFGEYGQQVDRAVTRALGHSAGVVVAVARSKGTGYRIGAILGSIKPWPVIRTPGGWQVHIRANDFRQLFFELGTLGRRQRKTKQQRKLPTRTLAGAVRGIKAGYFLAAGARAGRVALLETLRRSMP